MKCINTQLNSTVCLQKHKHTHTHCKKLQRTFLFSLRSHTDSLSSFCLLVWVMLSSGAELSHCEQRGNQSLFTNQLSSVPGWREDTKPAWRTDVRAHTLTQDTRIEPLQLPDHPFFLLNHQLLQHNQTHSQIIMSSLVLSFWMCVCVCEGGAVVAMAAGWVRAVW